MIKLKNMTLSHYIKSYKSYCDTRIRYFLLYRKIFKNYLKVILYVLKKKYPVVGILKNNESVEFNHYYQVKNTLYNLKYDEDNDLINTSIKNSLSNVKLTGCRNSGDIHGVFLDEEYRFLPVNGRIIVDIGANIGDSSIYFVLRGAKKVIALEPYPENYEAAKKNIEINNLSNKIQLFLAGCSSKEEQIIIGNDNIKKVALMSLENILNSNNITSALLKMDCEGCEYDVILTSSKEVLCKFSHIQIEYHYGYIDLKEKLEQCGFEVTVTNPTYFKAFHVDNVINSISNPNDQHNISNNFSKKKMYVGMLYATQKNFVINENSQDDLL